MCAYFLHFTLGPARGPLTPGPPPVSAPQLYNQYSPGQGEIQNGPPPVTQAPPRYEFVLLFLSFIYLIFSPQTNQIDLESVFYCNLYKLVHQRRSLHLAQEMCVVSECGVYVS